ncbi:methyl-CpG-binding domain-containing protein 9-like isoform X2 [Impatiens glandulifera]|uniref:methyl-CpG-binding domain-containing protein 9-like isoform X2 n=1 Tax=Impatiens glandulifera TaxID=253017 RepID=UPI001FB0B030|nr:methyl-CpG-binding domain-containing protein 9-like isoform X2 [Impatiens glandulifera]
MAECEMVVRNHCPPPGKPFSSKLPAHVIGDVIQVYELVQNFSEILGIQEALSFKKFEEELTGSGFDLNVTEEVKVSTRGSDNSNGTLLCHIHTQLLKLLMHEMQLPMRKKGTGHAKGCQLHVLVNELTWPEMARRYVLALLSIKRSLASVVMNDSEKSKVFRCLQGDGRALRGSITGVAAIVEDANVLVEAIKSVFGSLDTENNIQHVHRGSSSTTDAEILSWSQELEPVRKLPTNVGSKIRGCIRKALEKGPPLWAKEILDVSISEDIYKGNASGPTKKRVILVLDKLCGKNLNQQPDKERINKKSLLQSNVIMRRCHFALRCSLADDRKKVLCNLLSVQLLKFVENTVEGILESPVKMSHPLDFKTIDVRLEVGAYGTSYEAFLDDVRQVWANLRVVYANKPELVQLADKLSDKFERHYEKEVKSLFQKYGEYAESDYTRLNKEIDDILTSSRELPKFPWKDDSCKVCGIDKDNKYVLLCDRCDEGYHTYCLEPPLKRVPEEDWFCARCVETIEESAETTDDALLLDVFKELKPLAATMTQKEYWEWSLDETLTFPEGFQMETDSVEENMNNQSSVSCPWVSYQLEEEIEELLEWFNEQDEGESLLKELILDWKKSNLHNPKNNENEGKKLLYERRNNFLGMKASSLLAARCSLPYGLETTESDNEKVSNGKEPSSSIAHEGRKEFLEIALKPKFDKATTFLMQLKINILDIETALPEGALIRSKSQMEKRRAWRAFVRSAARIHQTIQAVIVLEDMIKIDYLKNWWCYWSSLSTAVKTPTLSALAMRVYSLDAAIEYEKECGPDNLKKGGKGILHI